VFWTRNELAIRRSSFRSTKELIAKISGFVDHYNDHARPFVLIMPGMAGNQCLMQLMKINPQAKVIKAGGLAVEELGKDSAKAGARSFVHKSYDTKRFLKTVREVLDSD